MESYKVWPFVSDFFYLASGFWDLSMYQFFNPFYGWWVFHGMARPHLLYPSLWWWTFGLFPAFDYVKSAAVNMCAKASIGSLLFLSLGVGGIPGHRLGHMETPQVTYWGVITLFTCCLVFQTVAHRSLFHDSPISGIVVVCCFYHFESCCHEKILHVLWVPTLVLWVCRHSSAGPTDLHIDSLTAITTLSHPR